MSSMIESLAGSLLSGGQLGMLSQQLGTDEDETRTAVAAALPMILSGLARNAAEPGGAQALLGALDRDHDGSRLDNLGGFLGEPDLADGRGILGHVFGDRRETVEQGVGKAAGLDPQKVARMMAMLAPLVMAYLGRQKRQANLDAGGLGDLLKQESSQMQQRDPGLGMLGRLLDRDGDGSVADDLMGSLGKNLLGNLFGRA